MSFRRAVWAEDQSVSSCTKCRAEFSYMLYRHHCRKCGLIFCATCSRNKVLIPEEELVPRPASWLSQKLPADIVSDEDNYRLPQRVCDTCYYQLKDVQSELRRVVSRAHQHTLVPTNGQTEVGSASAASISSLPSLPGLDFYLQHQIARATQMVRGFSSSGLGGGGGRGVAAGGPVPSSSRSSPSGDERIPRELLDLCQGVVFLTVLKAGFMFSGRYGTGLVLAKIPDDATSGTGGQRWSAPSAVMLSGLGWGLQVGAELTDVMLILASEAAVTAFKSKAQVSVGAELGVSVGPVGRSIESDVTAGNKGAAHAFSYAQSKGLFVGVSLEAGGIAHRNDVNRAFYGEAVSVSALLGGEYPSPRGAQVLYEALDELIASRPPPRSAPHQPPQAILQQQQQVKGQDADLSSSIL